MRVVILTDGDERHFYFCNQLIENTGQVVGVVTGGKAIHRSRREAWRRLRRRREGYYAVRNRVLNLLFRSFGQRLWREKKDIERRYFGGSTEHFQAHHTDLILSQVEPAYRSINNRYYVDQIRAAKPDVIVVMGTCMLGQRMLASAPYVLNMHTGLSPYYRGGFTNLWPILEGDFGCFGVTVHKLSLGIDSGDIVFSQRPEVNENDTYIDINCKCIIIGTNLMAQAIEGVAVGTLEAVPQWTEGKVFYDRDMNDYVAYRYFKKCAAFMSMSCQLEHEGRLPDMRLVP